MAGHLSDELHLAQNNHLLYQKEEVVTARGSSNGCVA